MTAALPVPEPRRRTSEILRRIVPPEGDPDPTLESVVAALGDRAFGLVMAALVAPNCIPFPPLPFVSAVTGVPLLVVALQFAAGRRTVWIPARYAGRTLSREALERVARRVAPWIERLERGVRPRWPAFTGAAGDRAVGLAVALLSLVMSLPIPGANVPPALAILLVALGVVESDGLAVAAGLLLGFLSVVWAAALFWCGVEIVGRIL